LVSDKEQVPSKREPVLLREIKTLKKFTGIKGPIRKI
jgi:hypothetical protein